MEEFVDAHPPDISGNGVYWLEFRPIEVDEFISVKVTTDGQHWVPFCTIVGTGVKLQAYADFKLYRIDLIRHS